MFSETIKKSIVFNVPNQMHAGDNNFHPYTISNYFTNNEYIDQNFTMES